MLANGNSHRRFNYNKKNKQINKYILLNIKMYRYICINLYSDTSYSITILKIF